MLCMISGQSANAEEEERIFHHIKAITKKTSNYSNSQVNPQCFGTSSGREDGNARRCLEKRIH